MTQPARSPLLTVLTQKRDLARTEFGRKHAFAQKWLEERGLTLTRLRQHSARLLTGATLSSALLLGSPTLTQVGKLPAHTSMVSQPQLLAKLHTSTGKSLTPDEETELLTTITQLYGVSAAFELDRNRLPRYIGKMGLEQHLVRHPGDSISQHGEFLETGMAPARGAFGYFAENGKSQKDLASQERYYIVLQTFLIQNWNRDWTTLKDWYKFRKFLVINSQTGKAVVACLGDSGPAMWTEKQFGGSPEVMAALGYYPKATRGDVFIVFLDDPGDTVPLGPVSLKGGP